MIEEAADNRLFDNQRRSWIIQRVLDGQEYSRYLWRGNVCGPRDHMTSRLPFHHTRRSTRFL